MKDTYNYFTVDDIQKDEKAILEVLNGIHNGRLSNDLKVLNYYKEIPVSYNAQITHIDSDMLELQVHQNQAAVMHVEKLAFLKSRHLPHDVIAKVYKANINKSIGLLHNFSYVQIRAERRRFVRVQLVDLINVNFRWVDQNFNGRMIDISIGGLSLQSIDNIEIAIETPGIITADLTSGKIEVPGRLLKVTQVEDVWHYIFEMEVTPKIEGVISQFIFQRQVEIIRELKDQLV